MIFNVDHSKKDAETVLALQVSDTVVDVFGVQTVVLERQKESTCCGTNDVIGRNV